MARSNTPGLAQQHNLPEPSLYGLLFHNSLDGIMLTAPDGRILDANPAACKILGRSREQILVEGRAGLIDNTDPRLEAYVAERKRSGKVHGELIARRTDGSLFPIEFSSVVFPGPEGDARTCLIIRDISARKTAEEERERLIQQLRDALGQVKTLSGLLPICASCHKIRDGQGSWHVLENYIRKNTGADFTHGICPECRRKLYPETISQ
ncbi:MAG TPA: PAS domain S-box protein [Candidatus Acidoferrales bacterium]|nr:PAS domain S-box protein [Candidatus Acidoferrales bacterium]